MPSNNDISKSSHVRFSVNWKIPWNNWKIKKIFVTSCNNVNLRWRAMLKEDDQTNVRFYLKYADGPVESFDDMKLSIAVVKPDQSICGEIKLTNYAVKRTLGNDWDLEDTVWNALVNESDVRNSDHLVLRIVLEVPISVFSFKIPNPLWKSTHPQWLIDLFNVMEDPQRSVFSNAKMISRDGTVFYGSKTIIGFQSAALEAMFRHPPAEGQPEDEYNFPGLGKDSLKVFLQFLYTAKADLKDLSPVDLIEIADAAEQYNLKPLKEACASVLWNEVVKKPSTCFTIIQFSDLHIDLKYLKHRAMDVLAENSVEMEMHNGDLLADRFGGGRNGKRLRDEFQLFASRRVEPI